MSGATPSRAIVHAVLARPQVQVTPGTILEVAAAGMVVQALPLVDALLLRPRVFHDDRGFFYESFHADRFAQLQPFGLPGAFPQENHSRSSRGVVRGLHFQRRRPQGKLVTVVHGSAYDVLVDIRRGSPTFGRWTAVALTAEDPVYLWIPPGFAHGFCATSDVVDFCYKCSDVYEPGDDHGLPWNDPTLAIAWPAEAPARLSVKDTQYAPFTSSRDDLFDFPSLPTAPTMLGAPAERPEMP